MTDWTCSAAFGDLRGFDMARPQKSTPESAGRSGDPHLEAAASLNAPSGFALSQPALLSPGIRYRVETERVRTSGAAITVDHGATLSLEMNEPVLTHRDFSDGTRLRILSDGRSELLTDGKAPPPIAPVDDQERARAFGIHTALIVAAGAPRAIEPGQVRSGRLTATQTGPEDKLWAPGRPLRVAFPANTKQATADSILAVARQWTQDCNAAFIDAGNHHGDPRGYPAAEIRIAFDYPRNASLVGGSGAALSLYRPTMMLGGLDQLDPASDEFRRAVLHEFGHALGLLHEHQNPEANLNWQPDNILAYASKEWGWDADDVKRNITTPAAKDEVVWSMYDAQSIMHYKIPADWVAPPKEYLLTTSLAPTDLAFARAMYPFPDDPQSVIDLPIGHQRPGMLERTTSQVYRTTASSSTRSTGFKVSFGSRAQAVLDLLDEAGNRLDDPSSNAKTLKAEKQVNSGTRVYGWVSRTGGTGPVDYQIEALG